MVFGLFAHVFFVFFTTRSGRIRWAVGCGTMFGCCEVTLFFGDLFAIHRTSWHGMHPWHPQRSSHKRHALNVANKYQRDNANEQDETKTTISVPSTKQDAGHSVPSSTMCPESSTRKFVQSVRDSAG